MARELFAGERAFGGANFSAFPEVADDDLAGEAEVGVACFDGGLHGVERHRLDHQFHVEFFRDVFREDQVKPDILIGSASGKVDEFHGSEVRGSGDGEFRKAGVVKLEFFDDLDDKLSDREKKISEMVVREIKSRLSFLRNVGLGYLTLSRTAGTRGAPTSRT